MIHSSIRTTHDGTENMSGDSSDCQGWAFVSQCFDEGCADALIASVSQWSSLRTSWRKGWRPATSPCWVWVTSSSPASSSPCCCASMSGDRVLVAGRCPTPPLPPGEDCKVLTCPSPPQPEEEQQNLLLLQLPGLHLRTGPHHLRHAHLQTRPGDLSGSLLMCPFDPFDVSLTALASTARPALPGPRLRRLPRHRSAVQRRADGDVQVGNHGNHVESTWMTGKGRRDGPGASGPFDDGEKLWRHEGCGLSPSL